jgi:hypothetical protein
MTEYDRNNLNFLLSIDATTLHDWYTTSSADDIKYAEELLDIYQQELNSKEAEIQLEKKLNLLNQYHEADAVLSKFRLC